MILTLARTRRLLFIFLLAFMAAGLGLMVLVELTDWHRLEAVTLDEQPIDGWGARFGLAPDKSLFEQPLAEVVAGLLDDTGIARVDIEYSLPHTLHIRTNRFAPVCFVLDSQTGRMHGLNRQGRFLPVAPMYRDWEHPILTGVRAGRLFELCDDARVGLAVEQLERLADDNLALYRLIDEIDFASDAFVTVTVSGLPYQLKGSPDALCEQLTGFIRFLEKYQPNVDDADEFDLRFENMIIKTAESRPNGK